MPPTNEDFVKTLLDLFDQTDNNIQNILYAIKKTLNADIAVYCRIDLLNKHDSILKYTHKPEYLNYESCTEKHLCNSIISKPTGKLFFYNQIQETDFPNYDTWLKKEKIITCIGIPLTKRDDYASALCIGYKTDYQLSDEDTTHFLLFARILARAEIQVRKNIDSLRKDRILKTLKNNSRLLFGDKNYKEVSVALLESIVESTSTSMAIVYQFKDKTLSPIDYFTKNEGAQTLCQAEIPEDITEKWKTGFRDFQPIVHSNPIDRQQDDFFKQNGVKSFVAVPIYQRKKLWGCLGIFQSELVYFWSEPEINALMQHADLIGLSLYNERKQKELRNNLETIKQLMNSIENPIYVADMETYDILFINDHIRKTLGPVNGQKCYQLLQNAKRPCEYCTNKYLVNKSGQPAGIYTWERQNQATGHWYSIEDRAIYWEEDRLMRLEIAFDITPRKQHEQKLQEQSELYRSLYENATLGLYRTTPDGKVLMANPALCRIMNVESAGDLYKINLEQDNLFPQQSRQKFKSLLEKNGFIRGLESAWKLPNHETKYVRESAHVVRDKKGNIQYYEGTVEDISEEKKAKEKLKISESLYKKLVDTSPYGIAIIDLEGNFLFTNKRVAEMIRSTPEQMIQTNVQEYAKASERKRMLRCYFKLVEHHQADIVLTIVRPDKTEFTGSIIFGHIDYTTGERDAYLFIIRDISEEIEKERQIEAALEEKDVMLKEIHHRVKNNLQLIISMINLQIRTIQNEDSIRILQDTQNRINSMALIHEGLYSTEKLSYVDFNRYIRNLIQHIYSAFPIQSAQINSQIDVKDIFFNINTAIPCGLIIDELITNSLKYAFPGRHRGAISIQMFLKNKYYTLIFSDDGVGLPDSFNLKTTTSLGMNLIHTLTRQLSGTIDIDQEKGVKYIIRFPEKMRRFI